MLVVVTMAPIVALSLGLIFKLQTVKGRNVNVDNPVKEVELIYVIINYGKGSKVLKIARKRNFRGTIIIGGTVRNSLLKF